MFRELLCDVLRCPNDFIRPLNFVLNKLALITFLLLWAADKVDTIVVGFRQGR